MRDEEDVLTDAERRLRAVLRADDERVQHVLNGARSATNGTGQPHHVRLLAAVGTVALVLLAAILWRASAPSPPALHISGSGSVVVVTSDDGRRWMVNAPRQPDVRGAYVIVFPQ